MKRETHTLRQLFLCLLMVALWLGVSLPARAADNVSLSQLGKWAGKTPDFVVDGTDLWGNKNVQLVLSRMLSASKLTKFRDALQYGISYPIQQSGDYLDIQVCEPHACGENFMYMFVNLKTNMVQICWSYTDFATRARVDSWLVYGKQERQLPKDGCSKSYDFGLLSLYGEK